MSGDHKITHSHQHAHLVGRDRRTVVHDHEHDHSSLSESFKTELDPIHRKHFHIAKYRLTGAT